MTKPAHKHSRARQTWRSVKDEQAPSAQPSRFRRFFRLAWAWLLRWVKYRFRPKHSLPGHTRPDKGIYTDPTPAAGPTRVAVLGDWGSGKDSARRVAEAVERLTPDYTIHLGDIYYVGARREVTHNCLGQGPGGVQWPTAAGSFAVPGNHEYMSGGYGFFDKFRPTLGTTSEADSTRLVQETSYFCVDVGDWRLIGLDTGRRSVHYAGLELIIAAVSKLPWIHRWKTWLPKQLVTWLRDDIQLGRDDTRGLVFLSHHQFYTALDSRGDFPRPGQQIAKLLPRPRRVVWLWGHEHRFAAYEGQTNGGGRSRRLTVVGRAVGNSGVDDPEPIADMHKIKKRVEQKRLTYADNRIADDKTRAGFNGFALLTITGRTLTIDHHAVPPHRGDAQVVLSEEFVLDDSGNVTEPRVVDALDDPLFITPNWLEANLGIDRTPTTD